MYSISLGGVAGISHYSTIYIGLFAYVSGVCTNLSLDIKDSCCILAASTVVFTAVLGIAFKEIQLGIVVVAVASAAFYAINLFIKENNKEKETEEVAKISNFSISMVKMMDCLPYAVLIENQEEVLVYNKKMIDLIKVNPEGGEINIKMEEELKKTVVEIGKANFLVYNTLIKSLTLF